MQPEIWLVQLLCPQRHAICGLAYERPAHDAADIEAMLRASMAKVGMDPWCGICASRDLHFEHGKLAVQDWEEATRVLRAAERDQIMTRAIIESQRGNVN